MAGGNGGYQTGGYGIWLDDMQMGIHRTGPILILIRETHVCNRIPLTGQCLVVSGGSKLSFFNTTSQPVPVYSG